MTSSSAGTAATHARPHHLHISTSTTTHHSPAGNAHSPSGNSNGAAGGSNSNNNTNQACAACKYQRRKCNPDCPLAPYFPADQQRRFLNAHRLFGVSNILKTLRRLRPELCAEAMSSLIFQSEMRAQDPVGGCYRLILNLERQHEMDRAELAAVLHHLALCRQQEAAAAAGAGGMGAAGDLDVTSASNQPHHHQPLLVLNADQEVVVDAIYANHHHQAEVVHQTTDQDHPPPPHDQQGHHSPQQQQLFDYFYDYDAGAAGDDASSKPLDLDINVDAMHQFDYDGEDQKEGMVEQHVEEEQHDLVEDVNRFHDDMTDHHEDEEYEIKAAGLLVDVFDDLRQAVDDVHGDDINVVDVKANININDELINVNDIAQAAVDLNEELQEKDAMNNDVIAATTGDEDASQMPVVESSQCRLGLAFSAL